MKRKMTSSKGNTKEKKDICTLEIIITSNNISKYLDSPKEVAKEIREMMAIDSIIGVTVLSYSNDQITIKIRTHNFEDFIRMREHKNWTKTAFGSKTGLNFRTMPSKLPLSISGVDKKII